VVIKVTDHGPGIEEDHKESVFHPFFTTKKNGTGLGLGVAKKITEAHGGKIYFRANQNQPGITFVVELPIKSSE
jgi:signal transduction histidine kinase